MAEEPKKKKGKKKWLIALVAALLGAVGIVEPALLDPLTDVAGVLVGEPAAQPLAETP